MRPLRILLVTNTVRGGAGKACHRLYTGLKASGAEARILCLDGQTHGDPGIVSLYPGVRQELRMQVLSRAWRRLAAIRVGDRARRYQLPYSYHRLERHPLVTWADVINLHWVPGLIDYPRFFRRLAGRPVVWTMHDLLPFSGGYHYASDLRERDVRVEARIEDIKARAVARSSLSIVAPSSWLVETSRQARAFRTRPHQHIFNGLPLHVYQPVEQGKARQILDLPLDKKLVLFTADDVTSPRKGLLHLIAALRQLDPAQVALVSIGRGAVDVAPAFEYHHLGAFLDDVSLAICYSAADLLVVPSLEDNSPNTIIESFACGRPVAAFPVGGIPELVCDQRLGTLARAVTAEALAEAIQETVERDPDPTFIRAHATRHFGLETLATNYLELFRDIVSA